MSKLSLKTRGQIIVHFDLDLCHNPRGHEGRGSNLCTAPGVVVFGRWGWRRLLHSVVSGRRPHHRQKTPSSGCFIRSVATTYVLAVAGKPENHGTSQGCRLAASIDPQLVYLGTKDLWTTDTHGTGQRHVTHHRLYAMLEAISDICALQKKGGAQLRIPPEFDPRFHPVQPSGLRC